MKDCREIESLKAPYVDGEAAPRERMTVDSHLSACPRCRDEIAGEREAHETLAARRAELRVAAPERLKERCAAFARSAPAAPVPLRPRAPIYRRWVPMSVAATIVLAVVGVFAFGLTEKSQALAFQMSIDHVKCARFSSDATHVDSHGEGERWRTTYGWPLRVAASAPDESLRLRGVRRCAVTDGRVAHLLYEWQGRPLSVYVLPADVIRGSAEVRRFGHDAVMWSQNGRTYVVLARDEQRPQLDGVLRYMKANVY